MGIIIMIFFCFSAHPDYRLVVTGHSLGAGTAILISMAILSGNFKQIVDPNLTKIKCVALAPPPVYRSISNLAKFNQHINIYINGNDCVPRLSLATLSYWAPIRRG
jgi:sn1-specific diacylglycerol lipase